MPGSVLARRCPAEDDVAQAIAACRHEDRHRRDRRRLHHEDRVGGARERQEAAVKAGDLERVNVPNRGPLRRLLGAVLRIWARVERTSGRRQMRHRSRATAASPWVLGVKRGGRIVISAVFGVADDETGIPGVESAKITALVAGQPRSGRVVTVRACHCLPMGNRRSTSRSSDGCRIREIA
jgi:hypothetical protein